MVRQSSELETNIVAVERIKEYTGVTREVSILLTSRTVQTDTQKRTDRQRDRRTGGWTEGWPHRLLNLTYITMAFLRAKVAV